MKEEGTKAIKMAVKVLGKEIVGRINAYNHEVDVARKERSYRDQINFEN